MRRLKIGFLILMAAAGLTLGTGVGASAGKGNTSSRANAHVRNLVLKGGAHTYVRVPDRVKRILERQDIPAFSCPGATTKTITNRRTGRRHASRAGRR